MTDKTLPFIPVPYMTVIPGRTPKQKVHKRLSDAKNAFTRRKSNRFEYVRPCDNVRNWLTYSHGWGQLYEFKDGEWQLLYEVPKPTADDIVLMRAYTGGNSYYAESRPWKLDK